MQDGNKWYYFNYDMRGSTTVVLTPTGSYKKDYEYDTFGNTTEGEGSFYNETQFTGATHDKSTGMHYLNARYYNPSTGRFLTQDSYTGNPYDPWTQNLYAYCGNNPVNFTDPTGHFAVEAATCAVANWWNPFGWICAAVAVVGVVIIVDNVCSTATTANDVIGGDGTIAVNPPAGTIPQDKPKSKDIARSIPDSVADTNTKDRIGKSTPIYRWGGNTYQNLTPRESDVNGLSFSTKLPTTPINYVKTTIEAVNKTGVLIAVKDGPTHVSIKPLATWTMKDWIKSRPNANRKPHAYTLLLKSITIGGK